MPERLRPVVAELERTRWAAELTDERWRLVWASEELRAVMAGASDEQLGVGRHMASRADAPVFRGQPAADRWVEIHAPFWLADGDDAEALAPLVPEAQRPLLSAARPRVPPARWHVELEMRSGRHVRGLGERVHDADGKLLGNLFVYGSHLPASLQLFLARGDEAMFARMAQLQTPGRRHAAILFADLERSTDLSRRLPSARYFALIREIMTALDHAVIDRGGVVGRHGGDGGSAFFVVEQMRALSTAARAAVEAGRQIADAVRELDDACRMNVGVHWGATLYMGQIVTGGRLEATALGDEVNECARVQEAARGGVVLASKPLLERLTDEDAAALGLDPDRLVYTLVGEIPGASEKAVRDAGALPVADVSRPDDG